MNFIKLKCVNQNVDLNDYLKLYTYVKENMQHPEWLGTFSMNEIEDILLQGGKIWLYYDNKHLVCSMFYIPSNQKVLNKRHINTLERETASLGPIMVSPDYVGNGYMLKMLEIFNKAHSKNLFSINNMYKDSYKLVDEYENERGRMSAFLKEL